MPGNDGGIVCEILSVPSALEAGVRVIAFCAEAMTANDRLRSVYGKRERMAKAHTRGSWKMLNKREATLKLHWMMCTLSILRKRERYNCAACQLFMAKLNLQDKRVKPRADDNPTTKTCLTEREKGWDTHLQAIIMGG